MTTSLQAILDGKRPRSLRDGVIPRNLKLLMLAPHPDDFDAIGVTLKFLSNSGNPLQVGVARGGSGVEDSYRPGLTLAGNTEIRAREQRNSLRFFGISDSCITFLDVENETDDQIVDSPANRDILSQFLLSKSPDIVFLPHGNDTNPGHRAMYSLLKQIVSQSSLPLAFLLNRDPKTIAMRVDIYMPFGDDKAAWKRELLRFHDSQHQRNLNTRGHGFDERVLNVNRQIARDLSLNALYAESFELELCNMPPAP